MCQEEKTPITFMNERLVAVNNVSSTVINIVLSSKIEFKKSVVKYLFTITNFEDIGISFKLEYNF